MSDSTRQQEITDDEKSESESTAVSSVPRSHSAEAFAMLGRLEF